MDRKLGKRHTQIIQVFKIIIQLKLLVLYIISYIKKSKNIKRCWLYFNKRKGIKTTLGYNFLHVTLLKTEVRPHQRLVRLWGNSLKYH